MRNFLLALTAISLPACTTYASEPEAEAEPPQDIEQSVVDKEFSGICDAEPAQSYVGQIIKADTGIEILKLTGARKLRWGPPDTVWTQDYRKDRVNVRYDRAMTITDISCG